MDSESGAGKQNDEVFTSELMTEVEGFMKHISQEISQFVNKMKDFQSSRLGSKETLKIHSKETCVQTDPSLILDLETCEAGVQTELDFLESVKRGKPQSQNGSTNHAANKVIQNQTLVGMEGTNNTQNDADIFNQENDSKKARDTSVNTENATSIAGLGQLYDAQRDACEHGNLKGAEKLLLTFGEFFDDNKIQLLLDGTRFYIARAAFAKGQFNEAENALRKCKGKYNGVDALKLKIKTAKESLQHNSPGTSNTNTWTIKGTHNKKTSMLQTETEVHEALEEIMDDPAVVIPPIDLKEEYRQREQLMTWNSIIMRGYVLHMEVKLGVCNMREGTLNGFNPTKIKYFDNIMVDVDIQIKKCRACLLNYNLEDAQTYLAQAEAIFRELCPENEMVLKRTLIEKILSKSKNTNVQQPTSQDETRKVKNNVGKEAIKYQHHNYIFEQKNYIGNEASVNETANFNKQSARKPKSINNQTIKDSERPDSSDSHSQEEGKKRRARQCLAQAQEAYNEGDLNAAEKLAKKAQNLNQTVETEGFLTKVRLELNLITPELGDESAKEVILITPELGDESAKKVVKKPREVKPIKVDDTQKKNEYNQGPEDEIKNDSDFVLKMAMAKELFRNARKALSENKSDEAETLAMQSLKLNPLNKTKELLLKIKNSKTQVTKQQTFETVGAVVKPPTQLVAAVADIEKSTKAKSWPLIQKALDCFTEGDYIQAEALMATAYELYPCTENEDLIRQVKEEIKTLGTKTNHESAAGQKRDTKRSAVFKVNHKDSDSNAYNQNQQYLQGKFQPNQDATKSYSVNNQNSSSSLRSRPDGNRNCDNDNRGRKNIQIDPYNSRDDHVPYHAETGPGRHDYGPYHAGTGPGRHDYDPYHAGTGPGRHDYGPYDARTGPGHHDYGPYHAGTGPGRHDYGPYHAGTGPGRHDYGPYDAGTGPGYHDYGPYHAGTGTGRLDYGPYEAGTGPGHHDYGPYHAGTGPGRHDYGPYHAGTGPGSHDYGRYDQREYDIKFAMGLRAYHRGDLNEAEDNFVASELLYPNERT